MSFEQATRFSTQWTVVAQYNHTSDPYPVYDQNTGELTGYQTTTNGLSVTVFQKAGTNEKYLAIRGTDDLYDIATDLVSVSLFGTTRFQGQYQSLKLKVQEWIGNGTLSNQFTVTGHSLGGFLATGLASEFAANVTHAYLYNAPGVGGIAASEIVQRLRTALHIVPPVAGAGSFSNLRADAGISPIAGLGLPVSPPIPILIENQFLAGVSNPPAARNHSQQVLTDALALYAGLSGLAPALSVEGIGQLLRSASAKNKLTLEATLDALRLTLQGQSAVDASPTLEGNRERYYQNLYALQASAAYTTLAGSAAVRLTATQDAATLASSGRSDFGTFLAVKYLLPVALEGATDILAAAHASLHAQWQADRTPAPGVARSFTDEYLADRAAMLTWKNKLALEDADAATAAYSKDDAPDAWFKDNVSGLVINLGNQGSVTAKRRILFDGDGAGSLSGGSHGDRLYGGAGDDTLYGYDGANYLEGNAGKDKLYGGIDVDILDGGADDDLLQGGAGLDEYRIGKNQGQDGISDFGGDDGGGDGQGVIVYAGQALGGTLTADASDPHRWSDSRGLIYDFTGTWGGRGLLTIRDPAAAGGHAIQLRNWQSGELGLSLAPPVVIAKSAKNGDGEDNILAADSSNQRVFGFGGNDRIRNGSTLSLSSNCPHAANAVTSRRTMQNGYAGSLSRWGKAEVRRSCLAGRAAGGSVFAPQLQWGARTGTPPALASNPLAPDVFPRNPRH